MAKKGGNVEVLAGEYPLFPKFQPASVESFDWETSLVGKRHYAKKAESAWGHTFDTFGGFHYSFQAMKKCGPYPAGSPPSFRVRGRAHDEFSEYCSPDKTLGNWVDVQVRQILRSHKRVVENYPIIDAVATVFHSKEGTKVALQDVNVDRLKQTSAPRTPIQVMGSIVVDLAATTIQRFVRGLWGRQRAAVAHVQLAEHRRKSAAATKLQAAWAGYWCRAQIQFETLVAGFSEQRERAACKIQCVWRKWVAGMNYEFEHLTLCLMETRHYAAIEVQRIWRGYHWRQIVDNEWTHWVIKWPWDSPGTIVEVVGNFSTPPWTKRYQLRYCNVRQCFALVCPRKAGTFEIKFIVDGQYVCDGSETVISDGAGQFNNVVRVDASPKEPPLQIMRRRLRQLEGQELSLRTTYAHSIGAGTNVIQACPDTCLARTQASGITAFTHE